jgi:hypothetical protein
MLNKRFEARLQKSPAGASMTVRLEERLEG